MRSLGGINHGARFSSAHESDSHYQVVITEHVLPGKKGKGKLVRPTDAFAALPYTSGNPIALDTEGDLIVDISDVADCNCLLKDEFARVRFDVGFGGFVPVGSSGLVREVQADGAITTAGGGTAEILHRGNPLSPTASITIESYGVTTEIDDGTKFWVSYTLGSVAKAVGNQVYRPGGWLVISEATSAAGEADIIIKAPEGGIPQRVSSILGSATCMKYQINETTDQLEYSTEDVVVVNWATSAVCVNGERYGVATKIDGNWVVIAEDCNDDSGPVQPQGGGYTSGTILSDFPDVESTIAPQFGFYTSGSHSRSENVTGGFA